MLQSTASSPEREVPSTGYAHWLPVLNKSRSMPMVSFIKAVNSGSNCPRMGKDRARSTRGSTSTGPGVMIVRCEGAKSA
ncbi:hypothetical protein D3C76_1738310 [compost metagenome]